MTELERMPGSSAEMPQRFQLASRDRMENVEALADRFFREVIGHEYSDCLVTDESDLYDFAPVRADAAAAVAAMFARLESHYLIDAREAATTKIVGLLEFLEERGVTS